MDSMSPIDSERKPKDFPNDGDALRTSPIEGESSLINDKQSKFVQDGIDSFNSDNFSKNIELEFGRAFENIQIAESSKDYFGFVEDFKPTAATPRATYEPPTSLRGDEIQQYNNATTEFLRNSNAILDDEHSSDVSSLSVGGPRIRDPLPRMHDSIHSYLVPAPLTSLGEIALNSIPTPNYNDLHSSSSGSSFRSPPFQQGGAQRQPSNEMHTLPPRYASTLSPTDMTAARHHEQQQQQQQQSGKNPVGPHPHELAAGPSASAAYYDFELEGGTTYGSKVVSPTGSASSASVFDRRMQQQGYTTGGAAVATSSRSHLSSYASYTAAPGGGGPQQQHQQQHQANGYHSAAAGNLTSGGTSPTYLAPPNHQPYMQFHHQQQQQQQQQQLPAQHVRRSNSGASSSYASAPASPHLLPLLTSGKLASSVAVSSTASSLSLENGLNCPSYETVVGIVGIGSYQDDVWLQQQQSVAIGGNARTPLASSVLSVNKSSSASTSASLSASASASNAAAGGAPVGHPGGAVTSAQGYYGHDARGQQVLVSHSQPHGQQHQHQQQHQPYYPQHPTQQQQPPQYIRYQAQPQASVPYHQLQQQQLQQQHPRSSVGYDHYHNNGGPSAAVHNSHHGHQMQGHKQPQLQQDLIYQVLAKLLICFNSCSPFFFLPIIHHTF
jgi:hypothetical protein